MVELEEYSRILVRAAEAAKSEKKGIFEMQLNVQSMQWSSLNHFADVQPITDQDTPCLEEIRQVLMKHNAVGRFGIALLHNHFDLEEDEILMETTDLTNRTQTIQPMKLADMERDGVTFTTTVMGFDEQGFKLRCGCNPRASGHHHL